MIRTAAILVLLAATAADAQLTTTVKRIRLEYATEPELAASTLEFGHVVVNEGNLADLRIGDGATPGGIRVGSDWWTNNMLSAWGGLSRVDIEAIVALSIPHVDLTPYAFSSDLLDYALLSDYAAATNAIWGSLATKAAASNLVSEAGRLDGRINTLTSTATSEVARLDGRVDSLTTTATSEVARLDGRVDSLTSTTTGEVGRLDGRVDNITAASLGALTAETDPAWTAASGSVVYATTPGYTAAVEQAATAFGWGDHGEAGYLTEEADAAALSAVAAVSGRVDVVESWGDHAEAGYLTSFWTNNVDANDTEIDNLNTLGVAFITGPGSTGRSIFPYDGEFGGAWNFVTDEPTVKGSRIIRHSTLTPCRFFAPGGVLTFDHGATLPHTLSTDSNLVTRTNRHGHTRMVITTTNDYQRSSGYIGIFGGTNLLDSFNPGCDGSAYTSDYPWAEGGMTITLSLSELPGAPGVTSAPPVITSLDVYNMADTGLVSRAMIDTQNQIIGGDWPSTGRQWANKDYADDVADAALAAANAETHYRTAPTDLQAQPVRWNPRFDTVTETNQMKWKYGGETYWAVDGEGSTVIPEIRSFTVGGGETAMLTVWSYSGGATNLIPEVSTNLQSWVRLDTNAIVSAEMVDDFTAQVVFTNASATAMFVRLVDVSGGEGRPVIYAHAPVLALYGLIVPGGATNTFSRAGTTNHIYVDAASNLVVAANGTAAITVSPDGNIGIGTTPSSSFGLRVGTHIYAAGYIRAGSYLMSGAQADIGTYAKVGSGEVRLGSDNAWIKSDGTNLWFRNIAGTTNALTDN